MSKTRKPNLTLPQENLLRLLLDGPQYCADYYPPAKKLAEHGLAEWQGRKLAITPAGTTWTKENVA